MNRINKNFNFRKFILFYKSEEYESIVSGSQIDIRFFRNRGFRPLHPDLLFVLKQKVSKKFKTAPASLEKLILLILLAFGRVQLNLTLPSLIAKLSFDRLSRKLSGPNSPQLFLKSETFVQAQTRTIFNAALSDFLIKNSRSALFKQVWHCPRLIVLFGSPDEVAR